MIGDPIFERDVVPREIPFRPVANIEPILRLESVLFKGLKNERFIDVIFAMCAGDANGAKERQERYAKASPTTAILHRNKNRRRKLIYKFLADP